MQSPVCVITNVPVSRLVVTHTHPGVTKLSHPPPARRVPSLVQLQSLAGRGRGQQWVGGQRVCVCVRGGTR